MRKLFTVKPGKMTGLFLLLGIVALQCSFTPAVTGENRTAHLLTDTSTTPVTGTAVATPKKPSSTRSNRTGTSSKQALAANLERETLSFGSPTGGPDTEMRTPKSNTRKSAGTGGKTTSEPTTGAMTNERKSPDTKTNNPKSAGAGSTKKEGTTDTNNKKAAPADDDSVDEVTSNIIRTVRMESTGTVETKTAGTTATRKVDAGSDKKVDADITRKTAVVGSTKTTGVKTPEAKTTGAKTVDLKSTGVKTTGVKSTGVKTTETKSKTTGTVNAKPTSTAETKSAVTAANTKTISVAGVLSGKLTVYDSLHLKRAGLSKKVFAMALTGMSKLVSARHIKDNLLAIVDFSQPSNKKRLYVIDLNNYQLLYNTYVAHGMKSGRAVAQSFSNKPASEKSSLGFYVTGAAYKGTNGYSLRLTGVEKGINDHAMDRGIVIHGADYVCEGLIESQGFIGRSFGCPAVAQEVSQELIDLLKGGSCLFIYHPTPAYKAKSLMLR